MLKADIVVLPEALVIIILGYVIGLADGVETSNKKTVPKASIENIKEKNVPLYLTSAK